MGAVKRALGIAVLGLFAGTAGCGEPTGPARAGDPAKRSVPTYAPSPELERESSTPVEILWDGADGRPVRIAGAFACDEREPERAARGFLARHAGLLGLRADGADLELATSRNGLAGTYLRFRQVAAPGASDAAALPVFDAEVVVLVAPSGPELAVREVTLAQRPGLALAEPLADIGPATALAVARAAVGAPEEEAPPEVVRGIGAEPARVAYRVRIAAVEPVAAWEVLVDAATGAVLSGRDRVVHATGTGMVFDPSPVASTGNTNLTDNNNATSPTLDAARFSVALPNLDGSGYLRGTWVDVRLKNNNNRVQSAGLTFNFNRSQLGFEQTNTYFHLDRAQRRLQTLGFTNANARQQVAIADGLNVDNSQYSPATLRIEYGLGGVDDAEDGDIVLHEYGHAIQDDQVPGWGAGGDASAMGEGFGDYLGVSFGRTLSQQIDDPYCVGEWDATSYDPGNPPCLRRTDFPGHYPEAATGEIHDDGRMWATPLFALETTVGADVMVRLVVESHFSLSTSASFFVAAQALLDADTLLFGGTHRTAVRRRLIQQGMCRILSAPSALSNVLTSVPVSIDNPRVANQYANDLDDTQTFSYPGAQALRLHFTTLDTETNQACLETGCDNVYLTDGNGDLYQYFYGQHGSTLSVVIPSDTVHIRLVTDGTVQRPGYHVDRVDVLGDPLGGGGAGAGGSGTGGSGATGGSSVGGSGATGGSSVGGSGTGGSGATGGSSVGGSGAGGSGATGGSGAGGSGAT
ncbi:MAG: M36 family metallopeptidase, partial [Polyangiaceae bacterium]|nr:M36 family metallopeptidase [Polyangiaceae bacterium]